MMWGKAAAFLLIFFISANSASAAYEWSNKIIIEPDGIKWQYTENISGPDSYVFKYDIDHDLGNFDRFVSAWELLKKDVQMRAHFQSAIEKEMDVKIDNSSAGIELVEVYATLSEQTLGPTKKTENLTNIYRVVYRIDEHLLAKGNTIWFLGSSGTKLHVSFPEGTQIISSSGMDNATIRGRNISGRFQSLHPTRGEVEITYSYHLPQTGETTDTPAPTKTSTPQATASTSGAQELVPIPFMGAIPALIIITSAVLLSKA